MPTTNAGIPKRRRLARDCGVFVVLLALSATTIRAGVAPRNISVTPTAGTSRVGEVQFITAVYEGQNGNAGVANAMLRVGDKDPQSIYVQYSVAQKRAFLLNESGHGYMPCSPDVKVVSHTRGSLLCSRTTVKLVENTLVITWALLPTENFQGKHNLYQMARAHSGEETDFELKGSWAIIQK